MPKNLLKKLYDLIAESHDSIGLNVANALASQNLCGAILRFGEYSS